MEAPPGFEPGMEVLQTSALPLGDGAVGENSVGLVTPAGTRQNIRMPRPAQGPREGVVGGGSEDDVENGRDESDDGPHLPLRIGDAPEDVARTHCPNSLARVLLADHTPVAVVGPSRVRSAAAHANGVGRRGPHE